MASPSIKNLIELILMSIGAICIAFLIAPRAFNLIAAAQLPEIWIRLRSWLRPPFLYLVVNGIIISIAAASRLHHHHNQPQTAAAASSNYTEESGDIGRHHGRRSSGAAFETYTPAEEKVVYALPTPEAEVDGIEDLSYDADLDNTEDGALEVVMYDETTLSGADEEEKEVIVEDGVAVKYVEANEDFAPDDISGTEVASSPLERQPTPETVTSFFESQIEEPSPPPTRAAPEGKKPLQEGNETLESTWKRIMEGRRLKTSDTWRDGGRQISSSEPSTPKSVKKSETFKDRRSNLSPSTRRIKRELSLSQDELNQRVEAFIRKFNQDMRLQRQNSMTYMMINPAA